MNSLQAPPPGTFDQADIQRNKDIAAFSYVWIMSVLIYFSRKESKFVQYHSRQGIVLFLMTIPLSFIPYIGRYLIFLAVAGMLLGFINAAGGQTRDVPLVGKLSRGELSVKELTHLVFNELRKLSKTGTSLIMSRLRRKNREKSENVSSVIPS